jgi:hypothetical protein
MRISPLLTFGLIATLPFTACQCEEELAATPGTLVGRFCDPVSGAGLIRVQVTLQNPDGTPVDGKTTTGDALGRFTLGPIQPGTYVAVGKLGALERSKEILIESDKTTEFADEGCHEPPPPPPPTGGRVTGRICDAASGAWVDFGQVWLSSPGNPGDVQYPGITDTDGRFEITSVRPGTYDAHVVEGVFAVDFPGITVAEGMETMVPSPATCDPPPGGTVTGRVCQDGVGWLAAARAYINLQGGMVVETMTDQDGNFTLQNVQPGSQVVRVEKDLFARSWAVTVTSGMTTQVPSPTTCVVDPPPPMSGTVTGRVCAPDGQTWLAGASVTVGDPANPTSAATTDAEGRFTLTGVPEGMQTVRVTKNSFTATYQVNVTAGGTTVVPEEQCQVIPTATRVLVVTGQWDNVRCVLTGQGDPQATLPNHPCTAAGLGLDPANVTSVDGQAQGWAAALLGDYARMSMYDIIFFNCGVNDAAAVTGANASTYAANLRRYVEEGGSVYASDYAAPLVEMAFPEFVSWQRNAVVNNGLLASKVGKPQTITANVTDPGIRAALGQQTIQVSFDLDAWVAMFGTAPATRVYIRATAEGAAYSLFGPGENFTMNNIPLTVGFDVGQGRVVFTSFHQERNITPDMQQVLNLLVFEL